MVIGGLVPPKNGNVTLDSQNPLKMKDKIGVYIEDSEVYGHLSVNDILTFTKKIKGNISEVFELPQGSRRFSSLSTGNRKKVMLTFALSGHPKALVLDEPFANLDEKAVLSLREFISKFEGAVILTTQEDEKICSAQYDVDKWTVK